MRLDKRTKLWIAASDGISEITLERLFLSMKGGTRLDDIEIVTTEEEANLLRLKYEAINRLNELTRNMNPAQVAKAVSLIEGCEDLMTLADEYC